MPTIAGGWLRIGCLTEFAKERAQVGRACRTEAFACLEIVKDYGGGLNNSGSILRNRARAPKMSANGAP